MTSLKFIIDGTANIVMHPARFLILQCLRKSEKEMFVEQIAKKVDVHPRMVSHHLTVLEKQGLVECSYSLVTKKGSKRGIAVRLCKTTEKSKEVFNDIREALGT